MVHRRKSFTLVDEPLANFPAGARVRIENVSFGRTDASERPLDVKNWDFFDGALLAVVIRTSAGCTVTGTAVVIAPGLALTARHVLDDAQIARLQEGRAAILCCGPTRVGADAWKVTHLACLPSTDLMYLSLAPASRFSANWTCKKLPLTTRTPLPPERVTIVGFRFPEASDEEIAGDLYAAAGEVVATYHPHRDRIGMPFPTIEVACGSLGGMSGGALLDARGYLLGIVSRGLGTDDGGGPSWAAWLLGGLNVSLTIPWPGRIYPQPVQLLSIDPRLLTLEGREYVKISGQETLYTVWFDKTASDLGPDVT